MMLCGVKRWRSLLLLSALLSVLIPQCFGIHFYIRPGERRCFTEDLPTDTKITGEVRVTSGTSDVDIDLWVLTPGGKTLYHRRDPSHGKFSFQTPRGGSDVQHAKHDTVAADDFDEEDDDGYDDDESTYQICVEHQRNAGGGARRPGDKHLVYYRLDDALDYLRTQESHAKEEHTDRLQLRLRAMHDTLSAMVSDLNKLQRRERVLLERNSRTARRLIFLAFFSLAVICGVSGLQFWYYKRFFKAKKLC